MFNKIEFIEDCKTLTIEQLRLKYKCRVQKLKKLMKELNILYINKIGKVIKWKADYTYFEVVDVPEKAYWLGLLYADGCISNCKSRIFNISLELIDLEVIERFKKDLNIESPIHIRKYKNLNHNTAYSISFKSEKVFNDLNRLGCFTNKTFTLEFPTEEQVPIHLLSHFIRGYFDGDGCIYIKNYHKAKATIAGNLMFSNGLVNHINNILFFNNKLTKNKNIYIFSVQGTNKIKTFFNYIYKDCNDLLMYRKYEKFIQLFKLQTEKKNKLPVKCKIPNCFGKHVAKNFCAKHYHIYKKGSPNI